MTCRLPRATFQPVPHPLQLLRPSHWVNLRATTHPIHNAHNTQCSVLRQRLRATQNPVHCRVPSCEWATLNDCLRRWLRCPLPRPGRKHTSPRPRRHHRHPPQLHCTAARGTTTRRSPPAWAPTTRTHPHSTHVRIHGEHGLSEVFLRRRLFRICRVVGAGTPRPPALAQCLLRQAPQHQAHTHAMTSQQRVRGDGGELCGDIGTAYTSCRGHWHVGYQTRRAHDEHTTSTRGVEQ